MQISEIWIYPIKSCGGIQLQQARVNPKGLEMDRRWMLIDDDGNKISQREVEIMSQIQVSYHTSYFFKITHASDPGNFTLLPIDYYKEGETVRAKIWDDVCDVILMPSFFHEWFSNTLGISCRLVFIPDEIWRPTRKYDVGLADGYHSLILSQKSVDFLNSKLTDVQVSTRNFRPNLVFRGGSAHVEDSWVGKDVIVGDSKFFGVNICGRCKVVTIDPETSVVYSAINKELASYRLKTEPSRNVFFGLNLAVVDVGKLVRVGDTVKAL